MRKLGNMFNVHNELFRWTIVLHNFFFIRRNKKQIYTSLPWSVIAVIDNKLFFDCFFLFSFDNTTFPCFIFNYFNFF